GEGWGGVLFLARHPAAPKTPPPNLPIVRCAAKGEETSGGRAKVEGDTPPPLRRRRRGGLGGGALHAHHPAAPKASPPSLPLFRCAAKGEETSGGHEGEETRSATKREGAALATALRRFAAHHATRMVQPFIVPN